MISTNRKIILTFDSRYGRIQSFYSPIIIQYNMSYVSLGNFTPMNINEIHAYWSPLIKKVQIKLLLCLKNEVEIGGHIGVMDEWIMNKNDQKFIYIEGELHIDRVKNICNIVSIGFENDIKCFWIYFYKTAFSLNFFKENPLKIFFNSCYTNRNKTSILIRYCAISVRINNWFISEFSKNFGLFQIHTWDFVSDYWRKLYV